MTKNYLSTQDQFVPDHNKIFRILPMIFYIHVYDNCAELESRIMKNEGVKKQKSEMKNEK